MAAVPSAAVAIAIAAAAVPCALAQTPQQLANSLRPAADPAQQLQTLLNVQDAEFRKRYFGETPIAERLLVDYGGYFRYGFSAVDDTQARTQYESSFDLRLYARVELDGYLRFFGRLRFEYDAWSTIGDFAPSGQGWQDPIGELYWGEVDLGNWLTSQDGTGRPWELRARVGRQFVMWADGLALAQYMYAGTLDAKFGDVAFQGLAGITAGSDVVDWDTSRPGYDNDTERLFVGAKAELHLGPHAPFAYYLAQFDENGGQTAYLPKGVPPAYQVQTKFQYDSQYIGLGSNGTLGSDLVYRVEFALETGQTLSDPIKHDPNLPPDQLGRAQHLTNILAGAGLVGLTWLAHDTTDARVDFQCLVGSGSPYRLDSGNTYGGIEPGKTDTAFNSLGYVNTGLVFAPEASNMCTPSLGWSFSPFKGNELFGDTRLSAVGFLYVRLDSEAPISVPIDPGGSSLVGSEFDFNADWRLMSDVNVSARYGLFIPNESLFSALERQPRQFFYVGVTYAF